MYADDTTIALENDEASFKACMQLLMKFSKASGLKINLSKTVAVKVGEDENFFNTEEGDKLTWQLNGKFKVLGISFNLDTDDITQENYKAKVQDFKKTLNTWIARNLTIFGRITIVKSLALPKLVHLFSSIPNPSPEVFNELQKACFSFIWKGSEKIKRTTLYNTYKNGGLKIPNVEAFCQALKMSWIKRMLDDLNVTEWKLLLITNIEKYGGNYIWLAKEKQPIFLKDLNPFWKDVFLAWNKINMQQKGENYLSEPLFFNENIKINRKTVFLKAWHQSGVSLVNDLVNEQGEFRNWEDIKTSLTLNTNFLQHRSIVEAIPRNWKKRIKDHGKRIINEPVNEFLDKIKHTKKPTKLMYNFLVEKIATKPTKLITKWQDILEIELEEADWSNIFISPFKHQEMKLRELQFKIVHRILPTNAYLYKCRIKQSESCTFCHIFRESIEHLLWDCLVVKTLWLQLSDWLKEIGFQYEFTKTNIILGEYNAPNIIEHIKLITKEFIIKQQRSEGEQLLLHTLKLVIHSKYKIEKHYMERDKFQLKWEKFRNIF